MKKFKQIVYCGLCSLTMNASAKPVLTVGCHNINDKDDLVFVDVVEEFDALFGDKQKSAYVNDELRHAILPCLEKENELLCRVQYGNPDLGGGCMSPYRLNEFKIDANGQMTYTYITSGIVFLKREYICDETYV